MHAHIYAIVPWGILVMHAATPRPPPFLVWGMRHWPDAGRRRARAQIRNKLVSKHFTEKTVKEIWRDRQAEVKAGKQTELCEFVFHYLHKRIGILSAVIEARPAQRDCISVSLWCAYDVRQSMPRLTACWRDDTKCLIKYSFLTIRGSQWKVSAAVRGRAMWASQQHHQGMWRAGGLQPAARPVEVQLGRGLRAVLEDHAGPGPRGRVLPADRPAGAHVPMGWSPPARICMQRQAPLTVRPQYEGCLLDHRQKAN